MEALLLYYLHDPKEGEREGEEGVKEERRRGEKGNREDYASGSSQALPGRR